MQLAYLKKQYGKVLPAWTTSSQKPVVELRKGKSNIIARKDSTDVNRCINRPKSTKQTLGEFEE